MMYEYSDPVQKANVYEIVSHNPFGPIEPRRWPVHDRWQSKEHRLVGGMEGKAYTTVKHISDKEVLALDEKLHERGDDQGGNIEDPIINNRVVGWELDKGIIPQEWIKGSDYSNIRDDAKFGDNIIPVFTDIKGQVKYGVRIVRGPNSPEIISVALTIRLLPLYKITQIGKKDKVEMVRPEKIAEAKIEFNGQEYSGGIKISGLEGVNLHPKQKMMLQRIVNEAVARMKYRGRS